MPIGSACVAARPRAHGAAPPAGRPVAASTVLRSVLERPSSGRVLAVFRTAVYVQLGGAAARAGTSPDRNTRPDADPSAEVVALVTSDGLRLPIAAVLAQSSASSPFDVHRAGDAVAVHAGALQVGPVRYLPARWWTPPAVRPGLPHRGAVRELGRSLAATTPGHDHAVESALSAAATAMRTALGTGDELRAAAAADAVLGLGPGLTPSGDDLLAGLLVTCHGLQGAPAAAALGRQVASRAADRTTALSAALLRCAAAGAAAKQVIGLVDALAGRRPLEPALHDLLAVGHTSGHDTARGVHLAAEVLLDRHRAPHPGSAPIEEHS